MCELEEHLTEVAHLKEKLSEVGNEINLLKKEIEEFDVVDAQKYKQLNPIIEYFEQKNKRLLGMIDENLTQLEEARAKQPLSYEEKVKLQALGHFIELAKQMFEAPKKEHALKLAETKTDVQSEICYRLNTELMPLTVVMPELEGLVQEINRMVEEKNKIYEEIERTRKMSSMFNTKLDKLKQVIESLSRQQIQIQENCKMHEERLANQEEDLAKLETLEKKKEAELTQNMEHTVQPFIWVHEEGLGHVQQLNEVRTTVVDNMEEKVMQVHAEQSTILEDLIVLKAIGDVKKE